MPLTDVSHQVEYGLEALKTLFESRLQSYIRGESFSPITPSSNGWGSFLSSILPEEAIHPEEELILTLCLAPHVRPQFLDLLIEEAYPRGGNHPHLGGVRKKNHRGFLPTIETALFLLAGEDLEQRFRVQKYFSTEHWFSLKQVIHLGQTEGEEPETSRAILLDEEIVQRITLGKVLKPRFSSEFPASLLTTEMNWEDLVLPSQTKAQIQDIMTWLSHHNILMDTLGMGRKLKPGYRALFHGSPGTGKTLTANLLGKYTSRDVFRIDLSTVISKYIGETEKNLSNLFSRAENKDWILFFDEADALFGKRTQVQNSNDRYANQEVAYLLQRIEDFKGLIILASNFKSNIDDAFIRRFQTIIHFPMPKTNERYLLWSNAFPSQIKLGADVDLKQVSQQFELSGATIMNVVQYVCLQSIAQNSFSVSNQDLQEGIQREFFKAGKIW